MEKMEEVMARLNHIEQDVAEVKKALFVIRIKDRKKTELAWKGFFAASAMVSKKWKGPSVVDEIRAQRSKAW